MSYLNGRCNIGNVGKTASMGMLTFKILISDRKNIQDGLYVYQHHIKY